MIVFLILLVKIVLFFGILGGIWGILLEFISKYIDHLNWEWWRIKECVISSMVGSAVFFLMVCVAIILWKFFN